MSFTSSERTRPAVGMLDGLARKLVLDRLSRSGQGSIVVRDQDGTHRVGNGEALMADVSIASPAVYRMLISKGAIGAAYAYQQGLWTSPDLVGLFRLLVNHIGTESRAERCIASLASAPERLRHLLRRNGRAGSRRNIGAHYDLGNSFFTLFLDETLTYSSAIFESADTPLREASEAKLRRICQKLGLREGLHVLEIGTGWGSFAILAAREFGCKVTTVTISERQHRLATDRVKAEGLHGQVEVLLMDYRDVRGSFDRIVSIEMIEAIGDHQLPTFFSTCSNLLKPDGAMALQAITMPDQGYERYLRNVDVIRHFIFPGSCCPSRAAIADAVARHSDLRSTHLEEIGVHYAETLRRWRERFLENLDSAREQGYSDAFLRLWEFYLAYCEAGFAERHIGTIQLVLSKPRSSLTPRVSPLPEAPYA